MTSDALHQKLVDLVSRWQDGCLDTRQVHEAAEALMAEWEWRELPESDPTSIVNEVICQLDALNWQLILPEDAPAILAFLATAAGSERQAWAAWGTYWDAVDYDERARRLQGDPYYAV